MAKKVYEENNIAAIAEAIREKTGAAATYTTAEMPSGVGAVYDAGYSEGKNVARSIVDSSITEYKDDALLGIWYYAFYQSALQNIDAPSVKNIGNYAFYQCPYLETVNLPTATYIGKYAFQNCSLLGSKGGMSFPEVVQVDDSSFMSCVKLSNIKFPKACIIGSRAFANCQLLQKIIISNKNAATTGIGKNASINAGAFMSCGNLAALIIKHPAVIPLSNSNALSGTPIETSSARIYVPRSLVSAYKEATNWSVYAAKIYAIEDYASITGGWN